MSTAKTTSKRSGPLSEKVTQRLRQRGSRTTRRNRNSREVAPRAVTTNANLLSNLSTQNAFRRYRWRTRRLSFRGPGKKANVTRTRCRSGRKFKITGLAVGRNRTSRGDEGIARTSPTVFRRRERVSKAKSSNFEIWTGAPSVRRLLIAFCDSVAITNCE